MSTLCYAEIIPDGIGDMTKCESQVGAHGIIGLVKITEACMWPLTV